MKRARVSIDNHAQQVSVNDDYSIVTADGRAYQEHEVTWLPPPHGTVFALGLNYVDHAAELAFKAPEEPLLFLKTPNTFVGHRQHSYRPDNVDYMHYEAELVVVIGKPARRVKQREAMDYVAGYTLCNDYAVRDYLENYYRPNLRVKCRDSLSPLGPYIIDRDDIDDPHDLKLSTRVNGELRQEGTTRDMVFNIPFLIEYISAFMTLQPGDMISTGTPKGLADVQPGDEVVIEVEQVGRLINYVVSEQEYFRGRGSGARD